MSDPPPGRPTGPPDPEDARPGPRGGPGASRLGGEGGPGHLPEVGRTGEEVGPGGASSGGDGGGDATASRGGAVARTPVGAGVAGLGGAAAEEAERAAARRRERAVSGTLAAGLILEGITVLFVPMAIARIGEGGISATPLALLLLLAAALFGAAGLQRRRVGLVVASVLQLAVIATGLMAPAMYFLGVLFACVWAYLLWVRQEIARASTRTAPG